MASRRFAVRVAKSVQEQEAGKCEMCHSVSPPLCLLDSFEADAEKEKNAALAAGYLSKARTRNGTEWSCGYAGTRGFERSAWSCRAYASRHRSFRV